MWSRKLPGIIEEQYEKELLHNRDETDPESTEYDDNDELKHLLNYCKTKLNKYVSYFSSFLCYKEKYIIVIIRSI